MRRLCGIDSVSPPLLSLSLSLSLPARKAGFTILLVLPYEISTFTLTRLNTRRCTYRISLSGLAVKASADVCRRVVISLLLENIGRAIWMLDLTRRMFSPCYIVWYNLGSYRSVTFITKIRVPLGAMYSADLHHSSTFLDTTATIDRT